MHTVQVPRILRQDHEYTLPKVLPDTEAFVLGKPFRQ